MINKRFGIFALLLVVAYGGITELGEHQPLKGIALLALALLVGKSALPIGLRR